MPSDVALNIAKVRERIRRACALAGRDENEVLLLAVGKTHGPAAIRAAAAAGVVDIGENYVQEALAKIDALTDTPLIWHFIGPLQSNKTRPVAERFAWVHGVDRLKIAERLAQQRPPSLPPLNLCLQVNIDGEASKSGVEPGAVAALIEPIVALPNLRLRGLMAIPEPANSAASFARLRALFDDLRTRWPQLDTLSMGMSADLEAAVAAGATIVRIGTDIFGARPPA